MRDAIRASTRVHPHTPALARVYVCVRARVRVWLRGVLDPHGGVSGGARWEGSCGQVPYHLTRVPVFFFVASLLRSGALQTILEELALAGYHCHHRVLSSRNVVPQERHRLYIVGFLEARCHAAFCWPSRLTVAPGSLLNADTGGSSKCSDNNGPVETETDGHVVRVLPTVRDILEPAAAVSAELTIPAAVWAKICAREVKAPCCAHSLAFLVPPECLTSGRVAAWSTAGGARWRRADIDSKL